MGTGYTVPAYMWYLNNECFFSLAYVGNSDPTSSGTCKIEGHYDIGDLTDGIVKDVEDIVWYFSSRPEIAYKFYYHYGEWGPLEYMTDGRFFSDDNSRQLWLYEKPSEYCAVCDLPPVNWDVLGFDMDSSVSHLSGSGDSGSIVAVEDWGEYYGGYDYGTTEYYTTTEVYYETSDPYLIEEIPEEMVGGDTTLPPADDKCTNENFIDSYGGCDFYEEAMVNPGDEVLICAMSVDFALEDGITAMNCCDACAGERGP